MRYFKFSDNINADVNKIAGEMINIYLGKTYYQNGELLKKPIP